MYDATHYPNVPEYTIEALNNWAQFGLPPGGFIAAVLANDLSDAVDRADQDNEAALVDIVRYVINELPMDCWGTDAKIAAWGEARRITADSEQPPVEQPPPL